MSKGGGRGGLGGHPPGVEHMPEGEEGLERGEFIARRHGGYEKTQYHLPRDVGALYGHSIGVVVHQVAQHAVEYEAGYILAHCQDHADLKLALDPHYLQSIPTKKRPSTRKKQATYLGTGASELGCGPAEVTSSRGRVTDAVPWMPSPRLGYGAGPCRIGSVTPGTGDRMADMPYGVLISRVRGSVQPHLCLKRIALARRCTAKREAAHAKQRNPR